MGKLKARRLGGGVFKLPDEIYRECLRYGIKAPDIIKHKNRWDSLGIPNTASLAAIKALEDKKKHEYENQKKIMSVNNRGQSAPDLLTFMVIIFFIAFISVIAVFIWGGIDDQIQNTSLPSASKNASSSAADTIPSGLDYGIVVGLGLLYIGLYITTRNIGTEPMFFWINLGLTILVLGFSAILGNAFDGTNISSLASARASLPATVYIGTHLLEFSIGAAAVILIGLFGKGSR